jgi:hypothetical protein
MSEIMERDERIAAVMRWSPIMIRMTGVCIALLLVAIVGLAMDPRVITGVPAWLKPAKFAASGAVYLFALAFMVRDLPRTRVLRVAVPAIALIIVAETLLIFVQAARGTTSHFNANTPLDLAIFSAMGIGIATVWIMSALILWQHWRTPATDRAMALALRLGLALNIAGAGVGWKMTQPLPSQITAMQRGERPFVVGAHTVGAPDGGPMVPIIRWSSTHGDLRVPHFLGMHALQILPLLLLGYRRIRRNSNDAMERPVVLFGFAACSAVFAFALLQALAGHPFIPLPAS